MVNSLFLVMAPVLKFSLRIKYQNCKKKRKVDIHAYTCVYSTLIIDKRSNFCESCIDTDFEQNTKHQGKFRYVKTNDQRLRVREEKF